MTIHVDATAGFLPLHLYDGPEFERAQRVCAAINAFALEEFGLATARPADLIDVSLQDMLDCVRLVERWNARPKMYGVSYETIMVPDDRLTAAVYTLLHFKSRSADKDDDSIPVRYREKRWGEETVHFLLVGARPASEIDEDESEAA